VVVARAVRAGWGGSGAIAMSNGFALVELRTIEPLDTVGQAVCWGDKSSLMLA
jgi:hypothetical protein